MQKIEQTAAVIIPLGEGFGCDYIQSDTRQCDGTYTNSQIPKDSPASVMSRSRYYHQIKFSYTNMSLLIFPVLILFPPNHRMSTGRCKHVGLDRQNSTK